jgi:hypothetical protein
MTDDVFVVGGRICFGDLVAIRSIDGTIWKYDPKNDLPATVIGVSKKLLLPGDAVSWGDGKNFAHLLPASVTTEE